MAWTHVASGGARSPTVDATKVSRLVRRGVRRPSWSNGDVLSCTGGRVTKPATAVRALWQLGGPINLASYTPGVTVFGDKHSGYCPRCRSIGAVYGQHRFGPKCDAWLCWRKIMPAGWNPDLK